jgi:hypothetical protein
MGLLIRSTRLGDVDERDVTPESLYLRRREFLRGAALTAGVVAGTLLIPGCRSAGESTSVAAEAPAGLAPIANVV